MAPPMRPDVVRRVACAWTSLTQANITGGFNKAKLTIATQCSHHHSQHCTHHRRQTWAHSSGCSS
ncbi:hypothetical protein JG688_00012112 [Phytophthora aleatoria]|uniref:Uncharacterized protein n=1 Tax=Phytophthora aleatoria TaxID=2496075 RepID=A0A8J5IRK3_9STRA|nr:hypothetical protein JG688_00012112 [Phytophthora aleatoria]